MRNTAGWRFLRLPPTAEQLTVVGDNYQLRGFLDSSGEPAVLWLPQLEGSDEASELALRLAAARGMASFALVPPLAHEARASWVNLANERVRAGRAALRLLKTEARPGCVGVAGLSLGGVVAVAVGNLEPDVDAVVAMLAGSGPALVSSLERLAPRTALQQVGVASSGALFLSPRLLHDRVLLVRALFDELVPARATAHLAEALGNPSLHVYPSGHTSFRVFLPLAIWRALGFIERACAGVR